jgi:hypothetical protein
VQVIVAHDVDARQSDQHQLTPMLDAIEADSGRKPAAAVGRRRLLLRRQSGCARGARSIDAYVAPRRIQTHPTAGEGGSGRVGAMREKIEAGGHGSRARIK